MSEEKCVWVYDEADCFYDTECNKAFQFTYEYKTSKNLDDFQYCPYCGRKIKTDEGENT